MGSLKPLPQGYYVEKGNHPRKERWFIVDAKGILVAQFMDFNDKDAFIRAMNTRPDTALIRQLRDALVEIEGQVDLIRAYAHSHTAAGSYPKKIWPDIKRIALGVSKKAEDSAGAAGEYLREVGKDG